MNGYRLIRANGKPGFFLFSNSNVSLHFQWLRAAFIDLKSVSVWDFYRYLVVLNKSYFREGILFVLLGKGIEILTMQGTSYGIVH